MSTNINAAVSQGYALGPLLYLIYANAKTFAGDTFLLSKGIQTMI